MNKGKANETKCPASFHFQTDEMTQAMHEIENPELVPQEMNHKSLPPSVTFLEKTVNVPDVMDETACETDLFLC